jgi:hypothetical protein
MEVRKVFYSLRIVAWKSIMCMLTFNFFAIASSISPREQHSYTEC